jgi:hypothetical protein
MSGSQPVLITWVFFICPKLPTVLVVRILFK